jgi:thioesterase domain-containing protein
LGLSIEKMADRAPVFCMFDVTLHQDLALALGRERTVIGLHAPRLHGPGRRGRPLCKAIAARYVASIREHQAHGPYHLVGLRFGGLVAYEAARQLEALGERVASVVIVDAVLPPAGAWLAPHALWQRLGRYLGGRAAGGHEPIDVPLDSPAVAAEVQRFFAAPSHIDAPLWVVRATGASVSAWPSSAREHGWDKRATQVHVHDIAVDPQDVMKAPHVRALARLLGGLLDPAPHRARAAQGCAMSAYSG